MVVVAHVQQEGWPDLRRRSSLLGADRIGLDAAGTPDLVPPVTARALLMEERRLFYVACTRALQAARRHRREVDRRRWRATVALPGRARDHPRAPRRATAAAIVAGRPGGRAPPLRRRPGHVRAAARGRRPTARGARRRGGRRPSARAPRRPVDPVGHPRPRRGPRSRCATPSGPSRCRPACSSR
ncbi:hypothetical protein [Nocardioides sp. B-3]|uniref:hypothetical protein n=1 Tax=Nocardioides sp. B-3 TaxID=2895565 RepID=UPI00300E0A8A